VNTILETR